MLNKKAEWALWKMLKQWLLTVNTWVIANIGTQKTLKVLTTTVQKLLTCRTRVLVHGFSRFPTEDEQYEVQYKAVLEGMNGKPVVVRTMDIVEIRNFLTSICITWNEPIPWIQCPCISISKLETQCSVHRSSALLRASVHGQLRIMFPMVALWRIPCS